MASVKIENLEAFSNKLSSISSDSKAAVNGLKQGLSSVSSNWRGKSYMSFSKCYGELLYHLNNFDCKINEVGKAISIISANYKSADNKQ